MGKGKFVPARKYRVVRHIPPLTEHRVMKTCPSIN